MNYKSLQDRDPYRAEQTHTTYSGKESKWQQTATCEH